MDQEFDRAKAAYEQNFEQFRALNQTMWQVPVIAMTLTGGLWFGAAKLGDMFAFQYSLLVLAMLANLGLVIVLTRVRYVMGEYLRAIKEFHPSAFVGAEGKGLHAAETVAITFRVLLLLSAVISLIGIYTIYRSTPDHPQTRRVIEVIEITK